MYFIVVIIRLVAIQPTSIWAMIGLTKEIE